MKTPRLGRGEGRRYLLRPHSNFIAYQQKGYLKIMRIITLLNEKGGVGKSTMSVNLACGLADKGYRVLIIDTDEQGHVAAMLGLAEEPCFFQLMEMNAPWRDVLRQVAPEHYQSPGPLVHESRLIALPSDLRTRALPFTMQPNSNLLRNRLRQLEHVFDFVIIDTSPAASLMHLLIYRAMDYVIFPTKPEALSFDGLLKSLDHLEQANQDRRERGEREIRILGILPTMYRANTIEHETNMALLRNHYGDLVWDPIHERILVAEAAAQQRSVFGYAPGTPAAQECWQFIERVEREAVHEQA